MYISMDARHAVAHSDRPTRRALILVVLFAAGYLWPGSLLPLRISICQIGCSLLASIPIHRKQASNMTLADWFVAFILASLVLAVWTAIVWDIVDRLYKKTNGTDHDQSD